MRPAADTAAATAPLEQLPQLVKPADLAHRLAVSLSTVYGWHTEGRLSAYRLGDGKGALRFDLADVEAFLASRREARG